MRPIFSRPHVPVLEHGSYLPACVPRTTTYRFLYAGSVLASAFCLILIYLQLATKSLAEVPGTGSSYSLPPYFRLKPD